MDRIDLLQELYAIGALDIDDDSYRLNVRFKSKLKRNPELIDLIYMLTDFIPYEVSLKIRLNYLLQNIKEQPACEICGHYVKMRESGRLIYTFPRTCSAKCRAKLEDVKDKRRQTNLRRYGSSNYLSSQEGKEIARKHHLKRFGVSNPFKSPEIREKIKQTNIRRFGVDNPIKHPEIRRRAQETNKKKYGVENPFNSPKVREKIKKTNKRKYGVENPFLSSSIRQRVQETMVDKYGVIHPIHSDTIRNKILSTMKERYNVDYFKTSTVPSEVLVKLNNEEWMRSQHEEHRKTFQRISQELNVASSTVDRYMKKHGIKSIYFRQSQIERDIIQYLSSMDVKMITNTRDIISNYEIDIFLPEYNIAIEVNGTYWHSEEGGKRGKFYHINKTLQCERKGIRLIHISDSEWILKQDIVKSRLLNIIGKSRKIYARKCQLVEVSKQESNQFFIENHIQGDANASIRFGLLYEGMLVACMTFGKSRYSSKYQYELIRYANKLNTCVMGGASKLFNHFIKSFTPQTIVSFSDIRWNTGGLYTKLGFVYSHRSKPNYKYFDPTNALNHFSRIKFQKHKLPQVLQVFDPRLTEWENMRANGFDRIWDCGNDVFVWNFKNRS